MTFKTCNYYEKSIEQGHCPFDKICDKNCYFTFQFLEESFKELECEYEAKCDEISEYEDNEGEIESLQDEVDELNNEKEELFDFAKQLVDRLSIYEEVNCETDILDRRWKHVLWDYVRRRNPMKQIKIVCNEDKYMPKYANETDACMDLKIVVKGEGNQERWLDNINYFTQGNETWLFPREKRLFGTGIHVAVPENHVMLLLPRSSTGSKLNIMLANTTGVIDAGYRDEVKLCLINYGDEPVLLQDAQRIAQFMIIPRPRLSLEVVEDNDDFRNGDRGGGFGSTGE